MSTEHMLPRRKDRAVSEEEARRIIRESPYGVFVTSDKDGLPYGVPVSHVLDGNSIYFHCALSGRKLENMAQNPNAAMTFVSRCTLDQEAFTVRYESAVAEGTAVPVTDREEKHRALSLICKQYAPDSFKDSEEYILPKLGGTGVCRLDMTRLSGKINRKPSE